MQRIVLRLETRMSTRRQFLGLLSAASAVLRRGRMSARRCRPSVCESRQVLNAEQRQRIYFYNSRELLAAKGVL